MGNAVSDGRPISWKNRDDPESPPHFARYVTLAGATYGFFAVGYGSPFDVKMGVNEAGLSLTNSLCDNMSGTSSYGDFRLFALSQTGSIAELRQAIIEDTSGAVNHWDSEPAICAALSDAHGATTLFELQQRIASGLAYYEYNPTDPLRLTQFPRQIVVRSNTAHLNDTGLDDPTGDVRYMVARDDLVNYANQGGLNARIWVQNISRHGQPGVDFLPSNEQTRAVLLVQGVNEDDDPRITTAWVGLGSPDYTMAVPVWTAQQANLSSRITSSDSTGIGYLADRLYSKRDQNNYDQYINGLFAPVENNLFEVVDISRSRWFISGYSVEEATRIHMEAADTVWNTLNSMAAGSGRSLNVPPSLDALNASLHGSAVDFSVTATDSSGSITGYDWDFGDGGRSTIAAPSHTYASAGTYLVRARVIDSGGARNSKWKYVSVVGDAATPSPTGTPTSTASSTATSTSASTATSTPTGTATNIPTVTPSPTGSSTLAPSLTPTATTAATPTATWTPVSTATEMATNMPTPTPSSTATDTATDTPTPTASSTSTKTPTVAPTRTPSLTPTRTATATTTPAATQFALKPVADGYVSSSRPAANYGTKTTMSVDGKPTEISFIKFDLSSLSGKQIQTAKLRFKVATDASAQVQTISEVAISSWSERGLTYNNRPAAGSAIASFASARSNTWIEVDITNYVIATQGQLMSVAIREAGADSMNIYTRESTTNTPVLIIVVSSN